MRIAIVEDEFLCRDYIRRMGEENLRLEVVGEARTCAEAIKVARKSLPEIMLIDLQLPDGHGTDIVQALVSELPFIRCLLMAPTCNTVTIHRIERARIWGFLDKNFHGVAAFRHALAEVAAGRRYFSPIYEEARSRRDQEFFDKR